MIDLLPKKSDEVMVEIKFKTDALLNLIHRNEQKLKELENA